MRLCRHQFWWVEYSSACSSDAYCAFVDVTGISFGLGEAISTNAFDKKWLAAKFVLILRNVLWQARLAQKPYNWLWNVSIGVWYPNDISINSMEVFWRTKFQKVFQVRSNVNIAPTEYLNYNVVVILLIRKVNKQCHQGVLCNQEKNDELWRDKSWILHKNTTHNDANRFAYLTVVDEILMPHPYYSTEMTQGDFSCFRNSNESSMENISYH